MPDSVVAAIPLREHLFPLASGQTGVVVRFTLSIVGLRESDNSLGLAVEPLPRMLLLVEEILQLDLGDACLIHCALPAGVPPAPEVFINALVLRSVQTYGGDDFSRAPSVAVVIHCD